MSKLGAQVTETDPNHRIPSYCVTQLEQKEPKGKYSPTDGVIWVRKDRPNYEDTMKQAVIDCLTTKFKGNSRR